MSASELSAVEETSPQGLETAWLTKALHKMEARAAAGLNVTEDMNAQAAWFAESGDSELLIVRAMGIVAQTSLGYVHSGQLETRIILEAAPDIILHVAAICAEDGTDFATFLAIAIEDFCSEMLGLNGVVTTTPLGPEIAAQPQAKDPVSKLALRAQAGDSFAANQILKKCSSMVWKIINNHGFFIPGGDKGDLHQEGLFGVVKAIRDYSVSKGSFMNFAHLTAVRQIITAVKTARRAKHMTLNLAASLDQSPVVNSLENPVTLGETIENPLIAVDRVVIANEELKALDKILMEELTDLEYICITMAAEGHSYDEMAQVVGMDRKAVDNALQRAKQKICASGVLS